MPNFIAVGQTPYEKSVTKFYTLHCFGAVVRYLYLLIPVWVVMHNKVLSIKLPNFVPFRQTVYDIVAAQFHLRQSASDYAT